ncbi:uncharacterized protein EI90DRAFT_3151619 [Cantharellus anzutake]|uniref:uncharacterized protein n=1 Tax=Cantharellus anzutake TaxID=1750568 RepID=UPI0019088EE2|nr:uncharacterized protein EI90DRAFT_3151619 [Cantharellus anzutake]KAF8339029.1 hypothetical protein EI90DRAFT_3151619 [Cantharellus anzutake]
MQSAKELSLVNSSPSFAPSSSSVTQTPHRVPFHLKYGEIDHADFEANATQQPTEGNKHAICERDDAIARRFHRERRYLFRRPRPLQYFRGKTLIRDHEERSTGRLELFFDLVFVGLISVLSEEYVRNPDGDHLAKYLLTYGAAWNIWGYVRELFNSFWNDDLQQKGLVVYVMFMLIIYGNNAVNVEETRHQSGARSTTIGSYLLASAAIYGTLLFYSFFVKAWRTQVRVHAFSWLLCAVALVLEYSTWCFVYSPTFKRLMKLHYSSAVAIDHEIGRFSDFFTLVMGEFILPLIFGRPAGVPGVHGSAGRIFFALIVAFCFQMFHVGGGGSKRTTHPLRRSGPFAFIWLTLHIPIVCALTICGILLPRGYSVGMLGLAALAVLPKEMDVPDELWLPRILRLAPRVFSGITVAFLPIAPLKTLDNTGLLGIAAALSLGSLLWENIASLDGPASATYQREPSVGPQLQRQRSSAAGSIEEKPVGTWEVPWEWRGRPCLAEPDFTSEIASLSGHRRKKQRA